VFFFLIFFLFSFLNKKIHLKNLYYLYKIIGPNDGYWYLFRSGGGYMPYCSW